jgi:hypothetical protein
MLGGVIAIACRLFLAFTAFLSGQGIWPLGAFILWVSPQRFLVQWVVGCLVVGGVVCVGGARAAGAALVGSSIGLIVAWVLRVLRLYDGDHLETLVHGAVILGSIGLVGFGLNGLRSRPHAPLGRPVGVGNA